MAPTFEDAPKVLRAEQAFATSLELEPAPGGANTDILATVPRNADSPATAKSYLARFEGRAQPEQVTADALVDMCPEALACFWSRRDETRRRLQAGALALQMLLDVLDANDPRLPGVVLKTITDVTSFRDTLRDAYMRAPDLYQQFVERVKVTNVPDGCGHADFFIGMLRDMMGPRDANLAAIPPAAIPTAAIPTAAIPTVADHIAAIPPAAIPTVADHIAAIPAAAIPTAAIPTTADHIAAIPTAADHIAAEPMAADPNPNTINAKTLTARGPSPDGGAPAASPKQRIFGPRATRDANAAQRNNATTRGLQPPARQDAAAMTEPGTAPANPIPANDLTRDRATARSAAPPHPTTTAAQGDMTRQAAGRRRKAERSKSQSPPATSDADTSDDDQARQLHGKRAKTSLNTADHNRNSATIAAAATGNDTGPSHAGHMSMLNDAGIATQSNMRLGGVEDVLRSMLERRNLTNRNPTPATTVSNGDPSSLIPTTADAAVVANISNPNATHPIPTITAAATAATAATTLNHNNNSNSGGPSHTGRLPNSEAVILSAVPPNATSHEEVQFYVVKVPGRDWVVMGGDEVADKFPEAMGCYWSLRDAEPVMNPGRTPATIPNPATTNGNPSRNHTPALTAATAAAAAAATSATYNNISPQTLCVIKNIVLLDSIVTTVRGIVRTEMDGMGGSFQPSHASHVRTRLSDGVRTLLGLTESAPVSVALDKKRCVSVEAVSEEHGLLVQVHVGGPITTGILADAQQLLLGTANPEQHLVVVINVERTRRIDVAFVGQLGPLAAALLGPCPEAQLGQLATLRARGITLDLRGVGYAVTSLLGAKKAHVVLQDKPYVTYAGGQQRMHQQIEDTYVDTQNQVLLRSRVFETINVRGAGVAAQHVLVTSSGTTARADLLLNNGAVVFEAKALQHGLSNAEFAQLIERANSHQNAWLPRQPAYRQRFTCLYNFCKGGADVFVLHVALRA